MGWDSGAAGSSAFASGLTVAAGDPGIDTIAAGILRLAKTNATSVEIDKALTILAGDLTLPGFGSAIRASGGAIYLTLGNSSFVMGGDVTFNNHLIVQSAGTPTTSALGANVTSVTFTGNDTRGTIAIVMAGGLAANTRVATCTFAQSYGATPPKVTLVDQTSGVGLAIVNSYVLAQATGVSFDLAFDQALVAGTYIIDYIVIG